MSDIWKMLFFSVAFATLLIGFVAVRQYSNGAARRACIANMKAINGAKATWSIKQE